MFGIPYPDNYWEMTEQFKKKLLMRDTKKFKIVTTVSYYLFIKLNYN